MTDVSPAQSKTLQRAYWPLWFALAGTLALVALGIIQGVGAIEFLKEGGPIENASVVVLLSGAIGFAALRPDLAFGRGWHITVIFLLLAARELDFDKRFMDKGVLQLRLYSGDYPLTQKLIGAFFVVLILVVLYRLVRLGWRPFFDGLRAPALWAWAFALSGTAVVIAKSLDGADRKLAPYGIVLSEETAKLFTVLEEFGELVFGLLLILALCNWIHSQAAKADRAG